MQIHEMVTLLNCYSFFTLVDYIEQKSNMTNCRDEGSEAIELLM